MLSNTQKRKIGQVFAKTYGLDYKEVYSFVQDQNVYSKLNLIYRLEREFMTAEMRRKTIYIG